MAVPAELLQATWMAAGVPRAVVQAMRAPAMEASPSRRPLPHNPMKATAAFARIHPIHPKQTMAMVEFVRIRPLLPLNKPWKKGPPLISSMSRLISMTYIRQENAIAAGDEAPRATSPTKWT
jgi:hypothetical protein